MGIQIEISIADAAVILALISTRSDEWESRKEKALLMPNRNHAEFCANQAGTYNALHDRISNEVSRGFYVSTKRRAAND